MKRLLFIFTIFVQAFINASAYDRSKPLRIVGDWDKPPFEFLNDKGEPAGSNIDLIKIICEKLDIDYEITLKEWSSALKAFERGDADIIFANVRRYRKRPYFCTENIINYNRMRAAMVGDSVDYVTIPQLLEDVVVLKPGDYSAFFFRQLKVEQSTRIEYQSPKVALQGLVAGDYKYFIWGEEPLKWKIKELNLEGITLNEVQIPANEIHIAGYDSLLINDIDDIYSRMKQNGDVQEINDLWFHPERVQQDTSPIIIYSLLAFFLIVIIIYVLNRIAKAHVRNATRKSEELKDMMYKSLHMGKFHVMEYDIRNDRWTNSYGQPILPEKGITLDEFTQHIHPNEQEEFKQKIGKLLNGLERKFELKKRWLSYDADQHWLNLDGHAMVEFDNEGRPAYIINAVNDTTQNVEEVHHIHEKIQKYERLTNMPFVGISFYDKDGLLIGLNDAMKTVCNYDYKDGARYWNSANIFDMPIFRNTWSPNDYNGIYACQHLRHEDLDIDKHIEIFILPLYDSAGDISNYVVSVLDVTKEHDNDEILHQRMQAIKNTCKKIERYENWLKFLTKQGDTYLWYSNIEKQTAYYYRSLQGKDPNDYVVLPFTTHVAHMPKEERAKTFELFNNQMPNQQPFVSIQHFDNTVVGGGESWFRITGTPLFDEDGHVIGHRGQSLDITKEMSLRQELEKETMLAKESVRLKSGFMASMTHELRTPLNAIIGFTDILKTTDSVEERKEFIRIIRINCDILQRLINDILVASSLNQGPTGMEFENIDFSKEFNSICLTLQQRMENGVEFIKENPYKTFYTRLDIGRVAQVMTNFVTNAVKFTQEGYIKLGYRYEREGLRIYCTDTGVGIPKEQQSIIFERFVKLNEFVQGTGMGLSICKSIAERLNGEVGVMSDGEGKGTTFWIWIPCERMRAPLQTS